MREGNQHRPAEGGEGEGEDEDRPDPGRIDGVAAVAVAEPHEGEEDRRHAESVGVQQGEADEIVHRSAGAERHAGRAAGVLGRITTATRQPTWGETS